MRHLATTSALLCGAAAFAAFAGCGAGGASILGAALGAVGLLALLLPASRVVRAGPPMPCQGVEERVCSNGQIAKRCCPRGAKCNFDSRPFLDCGHGTCVHGADPGRCPSPAPRFKTQGAPEDCGGPSGWRLACVDRAVSGICIMPMPTNYAGPGFNPPYRTCGEPRDQLGAACTTHLLIEDCHPTRAELGSEPCDGGWAKVCLGGEVAERCLPAGAAPPEYRATAFVTCGDGSCAVGTDATVCASAPESPRTSPPRTPPPRKAPPAPPAP